MTTTYSTLCLHLTRTEKPRTLRTTPQASNMDHINRLPDELLLSIFSHLPRRVRPTAVVLTCRRFRDCVGDSLWATVYLYQPPLLQNLSILIRELHSNPDLIPLIKTLSLWTTESIPDEEEENLCTGLCQLLLDLRAASALSNLARLRSWDRPTPAVLHSETEREIESHGSTPIPLPHPLQTAYSTGSEIEDAKSDIKFQYRMRSPPSVKSEGRVTAEDLYWFDSNLSISHLSRLLRNIRRLECLVYSTASSPDRPPGLQDLLYEFLCCMKEHKHSLQRLVLGPPFSFNIRVSGALSLEASSDWLTMDLSEFPSLKSFAFEMGPMNLLARESFCKSLPTHLETLQVRFPTEDRAFLLPVEYVRRALDIFMTEKRATQPNLKRVIWWTSPDPMSSEQTSSELESGMVRTDQLLKSRHEGIERCEADNLRDTPLGRNLESRES